MSETAKSPARPLIPAALGLLLTGCSVFGIRNGTPEPDFRVLAHPGAIAIRRYGPRIAAETTLPGPPEAARQAGFRRIAAYIFGANHADRTIAMTAPVAQAATGQAIAMTAPVAQTQDPAGSGWTIQFFMPPGSTLGNLPVPNDPQVRLVTVPAQDYAVMRFSGARDPATMARREAALLAALAPLAWVPAGPPVAWFYDPPWTLWFLRRNEVAVPVTPRAAG